MLLDACKSVFMFELNDVSEKPKKHFNWKEKKTWTVVVLDYEW